MSTIEAARRRNPLPAGTIAVGVGLAVTGVTSYGYILLAKRTGPEVFGSFSVLWSMVFFVGPGFFVAWEQEIGRHLAARRALGVPGGAVIRRAATLGAILAGALILVCLAAAPLLVEHLFRGDATLLVALVLAIGGYLVANVVEGSMSGSNQFGRYALYLGGESTIRMLSAVVCGVVGVATAGPYGLALGYAPYLAALLVARGQRRLLEPGPPIGWRELARSLAALVAGSGLAQLVANAGVPLIELLAGADEKVQVGAFGAAFIVARVPLFAFQAVQAALLPRLSALAAAGQFEEFRHGFRRLVLLLVGIGSLGTLAAFVIGPTVLETFFGAEFAVPAHTIGLLALGSSAFVIAMSLGQANIALGGAPRLVVGWVVGVATYGAVTALGSDLLLRVETGYVAGAIAAAVCHGVSLRGLYARGATLTVDGLMEAILDVPLEP